MATPRAAAILTGFFALTVPLMPVQALLLRLAPRAARVFPNWYHRRVCTLMGIKLAIDGAIAEDRPVLLVSNHSSWLDIPVLSAVAPVSFVAKKEVGSWPFVSALARLQRSVFVDRTRRHDAGDAANAIADRLAMGDTIVLFPEGTSSDGLTVLPFKSSLFGAVKGAGAAPVSSVVVQTVAVCYTHLHGLPLTRADRPKVGWYGDMEMTSHAWQVLKQGPLTATITIGPPVPLADFVDRKALAITSERAIRCAVVAAMRGVSAHQGPAPVEPQSDRRRAATAIAQRTSDRWT